MSRDQIQRVMAEQELRSSDLERKTKQLDLCSRELNSRETRTELDRQKLDEEKNKNDVRNCSLQLASVEQKKADENFLRLVEEQQREEEEASKDILKLERELDEKQKLEMEIQELKAKLQEMKDSESEDDESEDDEAPQSKMKELEEELAEKEDQRTDVESLNQTLLIKERQSNDELQEARKKLIKGQEEILNGPRTNISVKRMGEIDMKVFQQTCKGRFSQEAPLTQEALPSPYQSGTVATSAVFQSAGKRKRTTLPCTTEDGNEENEIAPEVHLPQKKKDASKVSSLSVVDQEMPPAETRVDVPALELPSSPEEENPIRDLPAVPPLEPDGRQQLLNAASVLKSWLVARLTSSANKLSTKEMIILAEREYRTLEGLGDDDTTFRTKIDQLISQHQRLEIFAEEKETSNEQDIKARRDHQVQYLSELTQKLRSAEDRVYTTKTKADSLKLKREELRSAILKLTEELSEVEEGVKTLNAEKDQCKEVHSVAEAELGKLDAEKEAASVKYREIDAKYNAAREEYKRMSNDLLQLVRR